MKTINSEGIVTFLLPPETLAEMKRVMDEVKGAKCYCMRESGWEGMTNSPYWAGDITYKIEYSPQTGAEWLREKCAGENEWLAELTIQRMGENAEKEFKSTNVFQHWKRSFFWSTSEEGCYFWNKATCFFRDSGPCPANPQAKKELKPWTQETCPWPLSLSIGDNDILCNIKNKDGVKSGTFFISYAELAKCGHKQTTGQLCGELS